jgi:putative N6-adenine-specific DNA methylase|tara:strand:- start:27 stop:1154 length:1128 start_codon:yes stop_codon:yes gene_type:complete
MKGIVIVDKGLENVAKKEIKEKINSEGTIEETIVIFPIKEEEELCKVAYTCQSIKRAILLINKVQITNKLDESINKLIKKLSKKDLNSLSKTFINCERNGEHEFNSVEFAKKLSKKLKQQTTQTTKTKENLYVYIHNKKAYLGIDFSGKDLGKRTHRIFTSASSLKGTLSFALSMIAKYKPGEIIVDPSCESGTIAIEAALYATKKPVHYYDKEFSFKKINDSFEKIFEKEDKKIKKEAKNIYSFDKLLRNIHNSKKNAKIAGVEKNINFSKTDISWLDTKFEKESVDKIITKLPSISKRINEKTVNKIYQELIYQAKYVLKKNGTLTICTLKNQLIKTIAEKKDFEMKEEQIIYSGKQKYYVNVFKKLNNKQID